MDNEKLDISNWKRLVCKHLGRVCVKRATEIMLDVMCVDAGIKKAYLFDVACVEADCLLGFIKEAQSEKLIERHLSVLVVKEDLLVIALDVVDISDPITMDVTLVDVSSSLASPVVLPEKDTKQLQSVISEQLHGCASGAFKSQLITLSLPAHVSIPSVFGYLLGYPVVYWQNTSSGENCLSMVPLVLVKVQFHKQVQQSLLNYTCYSFSVPKDVYVAGKLDKKIDAWFVKIKAMCNNQFDNPILHKSDVVLPAVAM